MAEEFKPPPEILSSPAWVRLQDQLGYFNSKAVSYQAQYKRIKLLLIAISAAIPILAFLPLGDLSRYVVAAAGVAIALLEGLLLLNDYGKLWVKYRANAESLQRERWLLLSGAGDYRDKPPADALRLLAERTESLLADENRQWVETRLKAVEELANSQAFTKERMEAALAAARQGS